MAPVLARLQRPFVQGQGWPSILTHDHAGDVCLDSVGASV